MFIEVNCDDGVKRTINFMRINAISERSSGAYIYVADEARPLVAKEPYETLIERLSECCPGMNGHFRAPA